MMQSKFLRDSYNSRLALLMGNGMLTIVTGWTSWSMSMAMDMRRHVRRWGRDREMNGILEMLSRFCSNGRDNISDSSFSSLVLSVYAHLRYNHSFASFHSLS